MTDETLADVLGAFGSNQSIPALGARGGETRPRYGVGFEHVMSSLAFLGSSYPDGCENIVKAKGIFIRHACRASDVVTRPTISLRTVRTVRSTLESSRPPTWSPMRGSARRIG